MNCNEEFVIKVIGKATLEWPNIDQLRLRDIIYESLYNYQVIPIEQSLVASDIEEKILIYLKSKELEGKSYETLKNYMYILRQFAFTIHKPIASVTIMDLRYFMSTKVGKLKPSTINTINSTLKSFFTWLEIEEYIPKNPSKKLMQNKLPKRLRKSLTAEELEKIRDACNTPRERAMLEVFFATGCRVSEVEQLNITDLNFYDNSLKVIGKGDKERIVYFGPKAKIYLEKYLSSRKDNNNALFAASKFPYKRMGRRSLEREISKIGKRAKIDRPVFCHLIRHTMATLGLKSGADITTIQHLLGHSTPVTTEIYAEVSNENLKHEYNKHFIQ